jgi:hypothetical protein
MRYAGGGIGHEACQINISDDDDNAMNVDDDNTFMTDTDQARNTETELVLQDRQLLEDLQRIAIGEIDDVDGDETEQLMDGYAGDDADDDSEDEENALSMADSEIESGSDAGPEDGEDESYCDTGYGDL